MSHYDGNDTHAHTHTHTHTNFHIPVESRQVGGETAGMAVVGRAGAGKAEVQVGALQDFLDRKQSEWYTSYTVLTEILARTNGIN